MSVTAMSVFNGVCGNNHLMLPPIEKSVCVCVCVGAMVSL